MMYTGIFQIVENFLEITLKCGKVIAGNIEYADERIVVLNNWITSYDGDKSINHAIIEMEDIAMVKEYGIGIAGARHYVECHERAGV